MLTNSKRGSHYLTILFSSLSIIPNIDFSSFVAKLALRGYGWMHMAFRKSPGVTRAVLCSDRLWKFKGPLKSSDSASSDFDIGNVSASWDYRNSLKSEHYFQGMKIKRMMPRNFYEVCCPCEQKKRYEQSLSGRVPPENKNKNSKSVFLEAIINFPQQHLFTSNLA